MLLEIKLQKSFKGLIKNKNIINPLKLLTTEDEELRKELGERYSRKWEIYLVIKVDKLSVILYNYENGINRYSFYTFTPLTIYKHSKIKKWGVCRNKIQTPQG